MTILQIKAFLLFLVAFGVPQITIDQIQTILDPSSTIAVPAQQAPVVVGSASVPDTIVAPAPVAPLEISIDSIPPSVLSYTGLPILAHLKIKANTRITVGYPNTAVSKYDLPTSNGTELGLEQMLGVSVANAPEGTSRTLQFLYENGTKPKYKYSQGDLLYESIDLSAGDTMNVQVRLSDGTKIPGSISLVIGGETKVIPVLARE